MALAGYRTGGVYSQTAGLRNILRYYGTTAPHTREPYTEAMLFGIAGGLGVSYWTWEFKGREPLATIFFRNLNEKDGRFFDRCCERINAPITVHETGSKARAEAALREAIGAGRPPLAWLDLASTPYLFLPTELTKWFGHEAVICGLDDERGIAEIDDRAPMPLEIDLAALAASRAAIGSAKNRLITVEPPSVDPDLGAEIAEGIRDCVESMVRPPISNLGLPGLKKWADMVRHPRDRKGWRAVFPRGAALYEALVSTYTGIVTAGTGGDAMRGLYADFLEEAARATGRTVYREAAGSFRVAAALWTQFAQSLLPDASPLLRRTRSLINENRRLLEEVGQAAMPGIANNVRKLQELRAEIVGSFPLDEAEVHALFEDMAEQLLALHAVESAAIEVLERAGSGT